VSKVLRKEVQECLPYCTWTTIKSMYIWFYFPSIGFHRRRQTRNFEGSSLNCSEVEGKCPNKGKHLVIACFQHVLL